jgi:hypothetical protein
MTKYEKHRKGYDLGVTFYWKISDADAVAQNCWIGNQKEGLFASKS